MGTNSDPMVWGFNMTVASWLTLAEKLHAAGFEIFRTSEVPVTAKGYSDEKVLALTLLARTISNLKGVLLLVRHKRIVEARTIVRCCLENAYWVAGLCEEGEKFTRKMLRDEMSHRKARGKLIFESDFSLEAEVKANLRAWMKNTNKRFADARILKPQEVASIGAVGKTYIFYGQLSSDSAHPSVDALNRYVVPHKNDEVGGIDVEPPVKDAEVAQTLEYLCLGVMSVCVGVNQILGGTPGGASLNELADAYVELSNRSKANEELLAS